jgi:hypothetical protein
MKLPKIIILTVKNNQTMCSFTVSCCRHNYILTTLSIVTNGAIIWGRQDFQRTSDCELSD